MGSRKVGSVGTREYDEMLSLLRRIRQEAGLGQEELSRRLGQSATYIVKIEQGTRRLDLIEFFQIADALGRDPLELVAQLRAKKKI